MDRHIQAENVMMLMRLEREKQTNTVQIYIQSCGREIESHVLRMSVCMCVCPTRCVLSDPPKCLTKRETKSFPSFFICFHFVRCSLAAAKAMYRH